MRSLLFASSIFFLFGLKLSSIIDLRGKAGSVDKIITDKITHPKPFKALPIFKDSKKEEKNEKDDDISKSEFIKQEKNIK
jgi:hypothetical protein